MVPQAVLMLTHNPIADCRSPDSQIPATSQQARALMDILSREAALAGVLQPPESAMG